MMLNTGSFTTDQIWLVIGFLGQAVFFMRFLVQWIASEKCRESVIPQAFWYFSFLGGIILCVYAVHKHEAVFMIGQGTGLFIYARNIYLIHRHKTVQAKTA